MDLYVIHWPGPKTGWPLKKGGVAGINLSPVSMVACLHETRLKLIQLIKQPLWYMHSSLECVFSFFLILSSWFLFPKFYPTSIKIHQHPSISINMSSIFGGILTPLPGTVCPPDWTPKMRDTGTWRAMEELYEQGLVKAWNRGRPPLKEIERNNLRILGILMS